MLECCLAKGKELHHVVPTAQCTVSKTFSLPYYPALPLVVSLCALKIFQS